MGPLCLDVRDIRDSPLSTNEILAKNTVADVTLSHPEVFQHPIDLKIHFQEQPQ